MRIALAGEFGSRPDEGMRKTAQELAIALERRTPTHRFDLLALRSRAAWRDLRAFAPDVVLYVPGPSLKSFALLALLKRHARARRSAALTLNPEKLGLEAMARRLAPDVLFVHSSRTEQRFRDQALDTTFLPIGVNLDRFHPPSAAERQAARHRFGLEDSRGVVLHVGHLKQGRNLRALIPLASQHHVLVVGSTATPADTELVRELASAGVRIFREFLPDVQTAYHAADVYAFPTVELNNSTEIPLSVLEALACGIPAVSAPYGAVPRLFANAKGVLIGPPESFDSLVARTLQEGRAAAAREAVLQLSWDAVAERITSKLQEH